MKLKQIKVLFFIFCLTLSSALSFASFGPGETASAYTCPGGYTYIMNGNDAHNGQCQQIYYSTSDPTTPDPQQSSDGKSYYCSNGTAITNGQCGSSCSDPASHLSGGKCLTPDGTNDVYVPATTNDGKALDPATNATCNTSNSQDGTTMKYVTLGNTTGCFAFSSNDPNATPGGCGVNVPLVDDSSGDVSGVKCGDSANNVPYVPKDTNNDSDKSACAAGTGGKAPGGNTCQPYSDFTNADSCKAAGGVFQLTNAKDPSNASDDVYTCESPAAAAANSNVTDCSQHGGTSTTDPTKCADGTTLSSAGTIKDTTSDLAPKGKCTFTPGTTGSQQVTVKTNIISCGDAGTAANAIASILKIGVYVLTAAVGVMAVGGLAWAAVRYAQAGDNQSTVSEAKVMIRNVIIGILAYGFMMALINFLLPGGLFS